MAENGEIADIKIENAESSSEKDLETDKYGFKGGSQYTKPEYDSVISAKKIREREIKWLEMLDNWDKWMAKKFDVVRRRCRKGIPSSLRGRAWQALSGSRSLQEQNERNDITFQKLLETELSEHVAEDISKDLHRQFPFHEMFSSRGGDGQKDLSDVLTAYAAYNTEDGYCQAQAPIAAALLMHMPSEEAFWCLVAMFEYYIRGYFSPGLVIVQTDGNVMQGLLKEASPLTYKHLEKYHVSPMLYCTEWFMCVFARTLPWPSVLRLWDLFFCEGVKVVFRCAIILIRETLENAETLKKLPGLYETMERLKKINQACMQPDYLMKEVNKLKLSEQDLLNEHKRQQKKLKKTEPRQPQVKRVYRYKPVHQSPGTHLKKQYASAVSVNSPLINQQAIQPVARKKSFTIDTRARRESPSSRKEPRGSPRVQLTRFNTLRETDSTPFPKQNGGILGRSDGAQNGRVSFQNEGSLDENGGNPALPDENSVAALPDGNSVAALPDENIKTSENEDSNTNNNSSVNLSSIKQNSPHPGSKEPTEIAYKSTYL